MDGRDQEEYNYLKLVDKPKFSTKAIKKVLHGYLKFRGVNTNFKSSQKQKNKNFPIEHSVQSFIYEENGEKIYRHSDCRDKLHDSIDGVQNLPQLLKLSAQKYGNRKCLGYRSLVSEEMVKDTPESRPRAQYEYGPYEWLAYNEVVKKVNKLTLFFMSHGIDPENKMAIFMDTSHLVFLCSYAILQLGSPFITLYSALTDENVVHALNLTEIHSIIVDKKRSARLFNIVPQLSSVKNIFFTPDCENIPYLEDIKLVVVKESDFNCTTDITPKETDILSKKQSKIDDLAMIMFTSGSGGPPKGVMITHENIIAMVASTNHVKEFWNGRTYLCFLPLAHIFEFAAETVILSHGGKLGYGNPLTLFDTSPQIKPGTLGDFNALKPDFICSVPLLLDRVHKSIMKNLEALAESSKIVFETAYNIKLNYVKAGLQVPVLDQLVFAKMKQIFGNELKDAFVGGATLDKETQDFFNVIFGGFRQAYGLTETCATGTFSNIHLLTSGNIGPPTRCVELKLIDWQEGQYFASDPIRPRGEIVLHGKSIALGYYKNEEATVDAFIYDDKTGKKWFKTGDIAEYLPDGTFRIIDRKKDIIKLKNGEYISLVKVENAIQKSKYVDRVCSMSDSRFDMMVAVVTLNRDTAKIVARKDSRFTGKSIEELAAFEPFCEMVKKDVLSVCKKGKLSRIETPSRIIVVPDEWNADNNTLTPTQKLRRHFINVKYASLIL